MLSSSDRSYIDKNIERILMYAPGMHPDNPDETLMYKAAGEWLFEELWKDELSEIAAEAFPNEEDPEEVFNALPEQEQRKYVDAYVDKKLDSMSYSDVYEYVKNKGYFEIDYDPHERDEFYD